MYNIEKGIYTCDTCGYEGEWDAVDEVHGDLWGCEKCGKVFCTKCFTERLGRKAYMNMMQGSDLIYCPDCYEKHMEVF